MRYPYLKIVHEEVVDGGWVMLLGDMLAFSLKTFLLIGIGYLSLIAFGNIYASSITSKVTPECLSQWVHAYD